MAYGSFALLDSIIELAEAEGQRFDAITFDRGWWVENRDEFPIESLCSMWDAQMRYRGYEVHFVDGDQSDPIKVTRKTQLLPKSINRKNTMARIAHGVG